MFGFVKKAFAVIMTFFNLSCVNSVECVSMNNQKCKARTKIIDVNNNEPVFYLPYSIKVNKCSRNCNNINDPYSKLCIPDIVKNINVKVFNLMSRIDETRHIIWHGTCKCICRLSASVCNSRQRWNEDKCRCECREELIDKPMCDKEFIFNPSTCECECNKACGIGEYLDYKNCMCRNSIVDKLVEECTKVVDGNEMLYNETLNTISSNDSLSDCVSCTPYIVLFAAFLTTCVIIDSGFIYFHWYSKKEDNVSRFQFNLVNKQQFIECIFIQCN